MSANKAKAKAERMKGKGKEAVGKVLGNERLEEEGKGDQAKGGLKEAGEHVKDTGKKVKDAIKDAN
jgi:uncharacterized protein YjbJ (UPF0337 family)